MIAGEQRVNPRLRTRHTTLRNGLLVGQVLNLSLGGLAIETTTALRIGSSYAFRVEFDDHRVRIRATVRWCRLIRTIAKGNGEVAAIYRAGLQLERPLELFSERGLQNSERWFDPELDVSG